jgi:hypothetical protein
MADLSQNDRNMIAKHPLKGVLDHLRDALENVEQSYKYNPTSNEHTDDQGPKKAISRLLAALLGHEVALELHSRTGNGDVTSELAAIVGRIRRENFDYGRYRSLTQLVIEKASDVDIWGAVLKLVASFSPHTPPTSTPLSFDGTPVTHSSASQQGSEQTKLLLEPLLLHEFLHCTYRNVEGFFPKYFEGKKWCGRAQKIYTSLKDRHVDGRWADFPDPPVESAVWDWLSGIQDEFLTNARGIYYTTSTIADLTGAEAQRQLDIFVKQKTDIEGPRHDWKDVRIIGEHRASNNQWKDKFLQLGRYVRDVFSVQPTRRFIHAFTLLGTTMELWVFDRSGPYSSGPFDINKEPEKFIRALVGYALMSDHELGLDTFIQDNRRGRFITITHDVTGKKTKIQLEQQPMVIHQAIICQGTTCFRSKDRKQVIKLSWPSDLRLPEADLLRAARDHGVEGVANLFGCCHVTSIKEMRDKLVFPAPHRFRNTSSNASVFSESQSRPKLSRSYGALPSSEVSQSSLGKRKSVDKGTRSSKRSKFNSQPSRLREEFEAKRGANEEHASQHDAQDGTYKNRVFSCLVISPAGRTIKEFCSVEEMLTALCDAVKAHRSLFVKANILHRDISENNIIITDPKTADGCTGMLIDLDLAIVDGERTGARQQTGTMEFMAIDVLRGVEHTYRHDLESFFYVLLWICARRAWEREFHCSLKHRPKRNIMKKWYGTNFEDIADVKRGSMHADGFEDILKEFPQAFDGIKPLCREVRGILFPFTGCGKLDLSTPSDPRTLYDPIIKAFEAAVADVAAGKS